MEENRKIIMTKKQSKNRRINIKTIENIQPGSMIVFRNDVWLILKRISTKPAQPRALKFSALCPDSVIRTTCNVREIYQQCCAEPELWAIIE